MKKVFTCLMFVLFLFSFKILQVYGEEVVVGGKNNFLSAKPTYTKNAKVTSKKIWSKDGNNAFYVTYEFDLSRYEGSINAGKFKMDFVTDSDSWYQHHEKEYVFKKGKKAAWERPVFSVYTTDYNNQKRYLINKSDSGKSNNGNNYNLNIVIPANTKTITFEFNSEGGGARKGKGFGCDYHNMSLTFYDLGGEQNKPVMGEENNFLTAKPSYQKNANIISNKIGSKDGNKPFQASYEFDLSEYKQVINQGKVEMYFKADSESWYKKHKKEYIWQDGQLEAWERPVLSVYTTDYNNRKNYLINKSDSGKSDHGKDYALNIKIPVNTKTITFEFNSEGGGARKGVGFGAYYKDMQLFFVDDLSKVDLFNNKYGNFTNLKNVKDKRLKTSAYDKLRTKLIEFGIESKYIDLIMSNVVGVENEDIGQTVAEYASLLVPSPYVPDVFIDKLADIINDVINNGGFEEIDLTTSPIEPKNRVKDFKAYYDVPVKADSPFLGTSTFKIKNKTQGNSRDNIKVSVSYFTTDGVEHKVNVNDFKFQNNNVYRFTIRDITYGKTDFIRIKYENDFHKPADICKELAWAIQQSINKACYLGDPISNDARDKYIVPILRASYIDEIYGDGDIGVIVAEEIIGRIPKMGKLLKASGGTDVIADAVRDIFNTTEVVSRAKITDSKLLLVQSEGSNNTTMQQEKKDEYS